MVGIPGKKGYTTTVKKEVEKVKADLEASVPTTGTHKDPVSTSNAVNVLVEDLEKALMGADPTQFSLYVALPGQIDPLEAQQFKTNPKHSVIYKVVDDAGSPIPSAVVNTSFKYGSGSSKLLRNPYTNEWGEALAKDVPEGDYLITAVARGYDHKTAEVKITGDGTITFILKRNPDIDISAEQAYQKEALDNALANQGKDHSQAFITPGNDAEYNKLLMQVLNDTTQTSNVLPGGGNPLGSITTENLLSMINAYNRGDIDESVLGQGVSAWNPIFPSSNDLVSLGANLEERLPLPVGENILKQSSLQERLPLPVGESSPGALKEKGLAGPLAVAVGIAALVLLGS